MGQCYDVTFDLKVKDRQGLIKAVNDWIDESNGKYIDWSLDGLDRTKLEELMIAVITDRNFFSDGDLYESSFSACYGWEGVMIETFKVMAPYLEDGSTCTIWPDSGVDRGIVKYGEAHWR